MVSFDPTQAKEYATAYFNDWSLFEKVWLITFSLVSFYLYFALNDTLIGLVTTLTGILTVVLVAKGRISNYFFGVINVVLYAYISYQSLFYGEVMLNLLYFLPMQFIGFYFWHNNQSTGLDSVAVAKMTVRKRVAWVGVSILSIGGYSLFLKWLNGNLPLFDSTSTVLSVIAQYLMVKRYAEQWVAWIVIDIVSIYMWGTIYLDTGENLAMVVMWTAYLINAIYGYYNWRKMEREQYEGEETNPSSA